MTESPQSRNPLVRLVLLAVALLVLWRLFPVIVIFLEAGAVSIVRFWWGALLVSFALLFFFFWKGRERRNDVRPDSEGLDNKRTVNINDRDEKGSGQR